MFWKKKIEVPLTNETKEVEVLETWVVSWMSADSYYSGGLKSGQMEFVAFTDEQLANEFYNSINIAFKLLRDKGRRVQIEKR